MYKSKIEKLLIKTVTELGFVKPNDVVLSISEKTQFGDYSSNIALQLSKQKHKNLYQNPREIANAIIEKMGHPEFLERVEVAGAGFINFFLKDSFLAEDLSGDMGDEGDKGDQGELKKIIVEYCDPNTHKMLHIGHLLPLTLGEALVRLLEYQGHEVFRVNYGSDIGLTVAKCLWGIEHGSREKYQGAREGSLRQKAQFLGESYAFAHAEYEKSIETKDEIDQITDKLYNNPYRSRSENSLALARGTLPSADAEGHRDHELELFQLWKETSDWSLGYFETIYSIFGTLFDRRINESEVDRLGKEIVLENIGKVFIKDEGAIIFPGKKYGLHNRVFINSKDNPTYEGKDVGLQEKYQQLFQADEVKIFSDKPQDDYFKVIIAANEMIYPHLKGKIEHFSYGSVQLSTGKMSSRLGNVIAAEDMINQAKAKIKSISPQLDELSIQKLGVAAIKFAFLKYSPKSDIVYDLEESVSIHGDTGPYVMYVYARIMSLLAKATKATKESKVSEAGDRAINFEAEDSIEELQEEKIAQRKNESDESKESEVKKHLTRLTQAKGLDSYDSLLLEPEEREILRQLEYFEFTVEKAANNFQPNELVKYLLNLTKAFNLFYESQPILGSKKQDFRLTLSAKTAETIKLGLYLLGIETVDKM